MGGRGSAYHHTTHLCIFNLYFQKGFHTRTCSQIKLLLFPHGIALHCSRALCWMWQVMRPAMRCWFPEDPPSIYTTIKILIDSNMLSKRQPRQLTDWKASHSVPHKNALSSSKRSRLWNVNHSIPMVGCVYEWWNKCRSILIFCSRFSSSNKKLAERIRVVVACCHLIVSAQSLLLFLPYIPNF